MDEAEGLLRAGWRQGSVCRPWQGLALPEGAHGEPFLILLTQSCTVVSPNWTANPFVEFAVATRHPQRFNPNAQEARGKNLRKLVVPVEGDGFDALEIEVNSRFFVRRELLLGREPDGPRSPVGVDLGRRVGGWMGRQYSRAALPNKLVALLKPNLLKRIEKLLGKGEGALHETVVGIYAGWEPDDEDGPYTVKFMVVCSDERAVEAMLDGLTPAIPERDGYLVHVEEGLTVTLDIAPAHTITLAEVERLSRFSEWDFLTDLGEELVQGG